MGELRLVAHDVVRDDRVLSAEYSKSWSVPISSRISFGVCRRVEGWSRRCDTLDGLFGLVPLVSRRPVPLLRGKLQNPHRDWARMLRVRRAGASPAAARDSQGTEGGTAIHPGSRNQ